MAQEIEIEFKTVLTDKEFLQIKKELPFPATPVEQTNYYFETADFSLKNKHSALRIREKEGRFTLTLKEPHPEGILETHDDLSKKEWSAWLDHRPIAKVHTKKRFDHMGIALNELRFYGSLKTERFTYRKNDIIYVLDKSYYFDHIDYELELEAPTYAAGKTIFQELLEKFHIPEREAKAKTARFFAALKNKQAGEKDDKKTWHHL